MSHDGSFDRMVSSLVLPCLALPCLALSCLVLSCLPVLLWQLLLCRVCVRAVWWHAENSRVYIQNVPVCAGTTPACGNTCGRGAGTHGDVFNVHTGRGDEKEGREGEKGSA